MPICTCLKAIMMCQCLEWVNTLGVLNDEFSSDFGHVSNEDGGIAMSDVAGDRTKRIYLAHLSLDNNMKNILHVCLLSKHCKLKESSLESNSLSMIQTRKNQLN